MIDLNKKYLPFLLAVIMLLLLSLTGCASLHQANMVAGESVLVKVLDVGQGDAILIRVNGQVILVDTGDVGTKDKLVAQIKAEGITVIDKLIITHHHSDHLGGSVSILNNFTVKQIYDSGKTTTTALYKNYLSTIKSKNIPFTVVSAGDTIDIGKPGILKVYGPVKSDDTSLNNNSIVAKLIYGNFSILLTGDAEEEAEERMIKQYGYDLHSTILKAGHHGSSTSSTISFLKMVKPEAVVISVGAGNDYHHPHPAAMQRFNKAKAAVYRTDVNGSVTIKADGEKYTITKEKL